MLAPTSHSHSHLCLTNNFPDLIDEIGFTIVGDISCDPPAGPTPAYLIVPPLRVDYINGMYCIRCPPPGSSLYYWASDPDGNSIIPKSDWERHGNPQLRLRTWIGSSWYANDYKLVERYLRSKNRERPGEQYARGYGYPKLILGDPHNEKMDEMGSPDEDKPSYTGSRITL
ncbi:hypothetical protein PM082_021996 [Marasmius tenuissimus]|nr:hypothetical protein PM082_021996 [Marasmius tenuissimus]